jgi:hypothetical protein
MMKRNVYWALLAVGMTVVSTGVVNAQSIVTKEGFLGDLRKKSIVGSWEELVRFPSGVPIPPQRSVMSFHDGGTVISTGQGGVIFNTDPAHILRSNSFSPAPAFLSVGQSRSLTLPNRLDSPSVHL